jgi:regulator of sigma E protease
VIDPGRTIVTVVLFIAILGSLVMIHELGHFVAAKLFRVRVLEFAIGFPPRVRILRTIGETVYTLNWLPIGGYVKLEGEDGDGPADPRSFVSQRLPKQLLILVAGVAMNVILAWAIFTGGALIGDPAIGVYVPYVEPGLPAEVAGIEPGDVISRVDGRAYGAFGPASVLGVLHESAGRTVVLTILRDGRQFDITTTLRTTAELTDGKGALGIGKANQYPLEARPTPDRINYSPATAVSLGIDRTTSAMGLIVDGVGQLATAIVTQPTQPPPASGPIGIATQIGDVFWSLGPLVTLYLAGILSANLAVVNILPFPPLDGGRMLILVLKRLAGSRLSLRVERLTYFVGFAMLLAFLVWVTGFDIARGLSGG